MEEYFEFLRDKGLDMTFCEFSDSVIANGEILITHIGGRDDAREKRECQ